MPPRRPSSSTARRALTFPAHGARRPSLFPDRPGSPPSSPSLSRSEYYTLLQESTTNDRFPPSGAPASPASSAASTQPPSPRPPRKKPSAEQPPPSMQETAAETAALISAVRERTAVIKNVQRDMQVANQRLVALRASEKNGSAGVGNTVAQGEEKGEDCPICLEKLVSPASAIARCGHMFHRHCIEQHIAQRRNAGCPICRQCMYTAELVQVMNGIPEVVEGTAQTSVEAEKASKRETTMDDGSTLIDLVDIDQSSSQGSADGKDRNANAELERLSHILHDAIGNAKREIASFDAVTKTVDMLEKRDRGRKGLAARERKARDKEQKELREEYANLRKDVHRQLADLKHSREELRQREAEVNEELSASKKLRVNLDLMKKDFQVRQTELELERAKVGEDQLQCLQVKRRYEALVKSRQTKESLEKQRWDALPAQGKRKLRRVSAESEFSSEDDSEDEHGKSSTAHVSSRPNSEVRHSRPEKPLAVFGNHLSKPSQLNRPAPPRKGRLKLSSFAPKRNKVQRPMGGIGARPRSK